jgi:hypothetical protein
MSSVIKLRVRPRRARPLPGKIATSHPPTGDPMRAIAVSSLIVALLSVGALETGCATAESRNNSYEQALGQWQGASEDQLVARWGKPMSEQPTGTGTGKWLTYVVNNGVVPGPTVGFSIGGFGFGGGHSGVGLGAGAAVPVGNATALVCTTRFLVENGRVSTWNFDGPGCGAVN